MKPIKELREAFLDVFDRLPEQEKGMPIVVISHRGVEGPCSWRVVNLEVECNTRIGEKMLRKMEKMKTI